MTARFVRIGNSHGVRIPQELARVYNLKEGVLLELEERREGILLRVASGAGGKLSWDAAYREMSAENAERKEWAEWDATAGDVREG
jgi:antitoxin component of MazEF toxin-antitoxin module